MIDFQPNDDQKIVINKFFDFLKPECHSGVFILTGSAGTGKTTVTKEFIAIAQKQGLNIMLLAPTNAAAENLTKKTGELASTIHSVIYTTEEIKGSNMIRFIEASIDEDTCEPTVWIIDESSMISSILSDNEKFISPSPLLHGLIKHIYKSNINNKIVFVGDKYQLTPIGETTSYALDSEWLKVELSLESEEFELTEIMRQQSGSNILNAATELKNAMISRNHKFEGRIKDLNSASSAIQFMIDKHEEGAHDKVVMIAATNSDVTWWNNKHRTSLGYSPINLSIGDHVIFHSSYMNDKSYISKQTKAIVRRISHDVKTITDIRFTKATLELQDDKGNTQQFDTWINLDVLFSNDGSLTFEQEKALKGYAMTNNSDYRLSQMRSDDIYMGAARLRFSYAMTCNKAQGSEWDHVLVHPFRMRGPNHDTQRWTYTAITRGRETVQSFIKNQSQYFKRVKPIRIEGVF
jgi:exodeoxyribonuclease V